MYQDGGRFYQIDMKLPKNYHKKKRVARAATSDDSRLWPNGIVPYVIADSISEYALFETAEYTSLPWA